MTLGNRTAGLSTTIDPPPGNPRTDNFGPNVIAIAAFKEQEEHV